MFGIVNHSDVAGVDTLSGWGTGLGITLSVLVQGQTREDPPNRRGPHDVNRTPPPVPGTVTDIKLFFICLRKTQNRKQFTCMRIGV